MKKMFTMHSFLLLVFFLNLSFTASASGGWVLGKAGYYFKVNYSSLSSNRIYNYDGSEVKTNRAGLFIGSIYAEYGLNDNLNAIVYFPFLYKAAFNDVLLQPSGRRLLQDRTTNVGDAQVSIKYGIFRNSKVVLSTSLMFGIPTGTTNGGVSKILQTGDGEFNQAIIIDASYSAYPLPVWSSVGIMVNNRTNGFSDEYSLNLEVGLNISKKGYLVLKSNLLKSFKNGYDNDFLAPNFSNNVEFHNISCELGYKIFKKIGIAASIIRSIAGRKSLVGSTYSLGLFYERK